MSNSQVERAWARVRHSLDQNVLHVLLQNLVFKVDARSRMISIRSSQAETPRRLRGDHGWLLVNHAGDSEGCEGTVE